MEREPISDTLRGVAAGDPEALDQLLPIVYAELKQMAARQLRSERPDHTLQPTALAHEVYLRLVGRAERPWSGRRHFMCVAARAMRAVLVDHARRRSAQKRGGAQQPVSLDTDRLVAGTTPVGFDDLDRALETLARHSERQARIVELRYFGGLTIEETAGALGISPMTVKRDWAFARAWLYRELSGAAPPEP
ncbi:MAG TPA: sigma-70 family RNA polymerase sigma factor [Candidatus Eisenbacteria bacterium]|nr:sigma-70 family RNA polymerase sigma factor [Candidatus Eisenbacteria bacterium]